MARRTKQKGLKQWTAVEARQELAKQERSGLSMSAYARQQGLSVQRLSWWRKRLREQEAAAASPALVPAVVTMGLSSAAVHVSAATSVGEVRVQVSADDSAQWVAQLLSRLDTRAGC